ncbi:putative mas3 protein [Phaeoacremonium minimum UCRPA7]|uniref:Putative mas3 protein n=1 Tax=Phaeoacremonium minimum (strain UCR-PA7) TaxID=1286976 RepID=R8BWQ8_PHAM7|nr:putative mas3 protein [Phaeoacremonium minimum UCRPA7]EOO03806.1 putative mas3 protein [Phaeoacremonium minimum UCRPA7]
MASLKTLLLTSLLATAELVAGHGAIIAATGDAGGSGMALGIDTSTPRDGTRRNPFQQDSTRFKGDAADTFGETVGAGDNELEAGTKAIMAETGEQLPQVSQGGEVQMTLHQVNADGGGPYTCMINADGTGQDWQNIDVTTTPPGENSRNRDGAATDFPLNAAIPADQSCTGTVAGQDNVCLVRCQNAARAGPFGGVVPVQMANTTTPAQARRALALSMKRSEQLLTKMIKRASTIDVSDLDPEYLAELRADGEEI